MDGQWHKNMAQTCTSWQSALTAFFEIAFYALSFLIPNTFYALLG